MTRFSANAIYASISLIVLYLLLAHFFDKAKPTGRCLDGVITRIDKNYTDTSRSGGGRSLEYYAHITIENGTRIVKKAKLKQVGQKVKLHEYKTKIRRITVYEIANCS